MSRDTIKTIMVYKALRSIARKAKRCEESANEWRDVYGDDEMRRFELVRAEAYREAVQQVVEQLDLDIQRLWPDFIVDD